LVLTQREAGWLLVSLCEELGFCLPREDEERLAAEPPATVDAFARAVFEAEGVDPDLDKKLYAQVRAMVAAAFERAELRKP
jgi:hypothetical protein